MAAALGAPPPGESTGKADDGPDGFEYLPCNDSRPPNSRFVCDKVSEVDLLGYQGQFRWTINRPVRYRLGERRFARNACPHTNVSACVRSSRKMISAGSRIINTPYLGGLRNASAQPQRRVAKNNAITLIVIFSDRQTRSEGNTEHNNRTSLLTTKLLEAWMVGGHAPPGSLDLVSCPPDGPLPFRSRRRDKSELAVDLGALSDDFECRCLSHWFG